MAGWLPLFAAPANAPLAPLVVQTSVVSNPKPEFLIYGQFVAGDIIQIDRAVDGTFFASPTTTTHTVTSGELGGTPISLSLASLSAGSYEYRARYKHAGGSYGPYSPIESGVVDLTLNFTYQGQFSPSGSGGSTSRTVTGAGIGSAYSNRRVYVFGLQTDDGGTAVVTDLKINGVSATLFASAPTNGYAMYYCATALVPTGTTCDIAITTSVGVFVFGPLIVYTCDDSLLSNAAPNDVKHVNTTSTTSASIANNLATLSGGVTVTYGLVFGPISVAPTITSSSDTPIPDLSDTRAYEAAHFLNNQTRNVGLTWSWSPAADSYTTAWSFR